MNCYTEFRKFTLEDIGRKPALFDNDTDGHAKLGLVDFYGELYTESSEKPIWFIRHSNPDSARFAGIHEPGDGYLSVQKPLHWKDLAQKEDPIEKYRCVNDTHYTISCSKPYFSYQVSEKSIHIRETDCLDLTGELFPVSIIKHANPSASSSQITQTCILNGVLDGKKVKGIGNFEVVYFPETEHRELNDYAAYVYAYDAGVREDGRKEAVMIYFSLDGKSHAIYWLEGQKPVVSMQVTMQSKWQELPYVSDHTCIYKNAVFSFGGKEIHFNGKWGAKGLTPYPRTELSGQSQVLGIWYEGSKPYNHKMSMTFHENMGVFPNALERVGFKVGEQDI